MRLGWIALIIGLVPTAIGGQALYEARVAGEKKDIAFARLVEEMPRFGWNRVTGASWSLIDAVTLRSVTGATLPDLYVRVHADGAPGGDDAPAKLLVHIENQALADRVDDILSRAADQPQLLAENAALLETEHPVEGTLETLLTIDPTDRKGVRGALGERLADDYLVIAQGRRPDDIGRAILLLAVGLGLLALSALLLLCGGQTPGDAPAEG